jgi:DNA-binding NarL/FixJ family response regulator
VASRRGTFERHEEPLGGIGASAELLHSVREQPAGARVLIVEDHVLVAVGLQLALSARGWEVETTDGPTAADVIEHAEQFQPQCILLDIGLGQAVGTGIDLIAPLRATGADVVMLTAETRRFVLASCLDAGAAGWIGKDAFLDEVVARLTDVLAGTPLIGRSVRDAMIDELRIERAGQRRALSPFERLTLREREVLAALVDGQSAEEIAEFQYVALTTVRSQIRAVLQKLGVRSQLAAVAHANRVGWKPGLGVLSVA